jgi:hypothetical protein
MARKKSKGTVLSVFKGREAKLNRAIFQVLATKDALAIYDVAKAIKNERGMRNTKYTNVNRRIRALTEQGYTEQAGKRETQAGSQALLYRLTTRANVAILLSQINLDKLVKEADEETLVSEMTALVLFYLNAGISVGRPTLIKKRANA